MNIQKKLLVLTLGLLCSANARAMDDGDNSTNTSPFEAMFSKLDESVKSSQEFYSSGKMRKTSGEFIPEETLYTYFENLTDKKASEMLYAVINGAAWGQKYECTPWVTFSLIYLMDKGYKNEVEQAMGLVEKCPAAEWGGHTRPVLKFMLEHFEDLSSLNNYKKWYKEVASDSENIDLKAPFNGENCLSKQLERAGLTKKNNELFCNIYFESMFDPYEIENLIKKYTPETGDSSPAKS